LGLLIGLGISAFQIMTWFLLGVWNPISIATVLDMLLVGIENLRPMESLIGLSMERPSLDYLRAQLLR